MLLLPIPQHYQRPTYHHLPLPLLSLPPRPSKQVSNPPPAIEKPSSPTPPPSPPLQAARPLTFPNPPHRRAVSAPTVGEARHPMGGAACGSTPAHRPPERAWINSRHELFPCICDITQTL